MLSRSSDFGTVVMGSSGWRRDDLNEPLSYKSRLVWVKSHANRLSRLALNVILSPRVVIDVSWLSLRRNWTWLWSMTVKLTYSRLALIVIPFFDWELLTF